MPFKQQKEIKDEKWMSIPVIPEMIKASTNLGKGEIETPKEIKEIEALIFSRGRLNAQFFRGKKHLYVLPSWVERMLAVNSPGVISLGHTSVFINTNYRNWVAFGGLDCFSEGIVTDDGLIVPIIDGYGILVGIIDNQQAYFMSRDGKTTQKLRKGFLPIVENFWNVNEREYKQTVFGGKIGSSEIGMVNIEKEENNEDQLILAIRPFNQEGISLINSIEYRPKDQAIVINREVSLRVVQKPEKIAVGSYTFNGDSARKVIELAMDYSKNNSISIQCSVGLANMTLIFPKNIHKVEAYFKMTKEAINSPPLQEIIESSWLEKLAFGLSLETGDKEIDRLYYASLVNLLLLVDPGTITPGPSKYHRFWCRDAAYLISALDRTGYNAYAQEALEQFFKRQKTNGFYYSHEGEFDSNGEGIWVLSEHAKLTRDFLWLEKAFESIRKAAEWLITTRKLEKKEAAVGQENFIIGLLPPGFSAEHLGPCDYFYWDNFWGVAGLREAAHCAKILQHESAQYLQKEYEKYLFDLFSSATKIFEKNGFLPVGPFREDDSAMIANLCSYHPTKIWDTSNEILKKTGDMIYNKFTHKGGFFHEVAWNCYGTYLTMHLAQFYHDAHMSDKVAEILIWLMKNKTCEMGWAEGISPQTMHGGMGDSPHGWASADWIHLLRNLFCTETLGGSIKLLSGFPVAYLKKGVKATRLNTYYGNIDFTAKITKKKMAMKINAHLALPSIKIMTPYPVSKISVDKGEAFKINEECVEISSHTKTVSIEFE